MTPHLAQVPMSNLGVFSVENLEDLTYKTDGEPVFVEPTTTWSSGKKRTWEDHYYGEDPYYWEVADRADEAHQVSLERSKTEAREREVARGEAQQSRLGAVDPVQPTCHAADDPFEQNVLESSDEGLA